MKVTVEGPLVDADAAWRLISETGLLLRLAGAPPVRIRLAEDGDGEVIPSGTMLGPAGLRHAFEDAGLSWVRGQHLHLERRIQGPLLRSIRLTATLTPADGGVQPTLTLEVEPRIGASSGLVSLYTRGVVSGWNRELAALPGPGRMGEPRVRRALDITTLAALSRWSERGAGTALRARVERWMRQAPLRQLRRLSPLGLAEGWQEDGELDRASAVLDELVEGIAAGALDLHWAVVCPRCAAPVQQVEALNRLPEQARCPWCGVTSPVDLVSTVEAVLAAPGWLGSGEPSCHSLAAASPETVAAVLLSPRSAHSFALSLPPGEYRLVAGAGAGRLDGVLQVTEGGPAAAQWTPGQGPVAVGTGVVSLLVQNPTGRRLFVRMLETSGLRPRTPAFALLCRPRFQARLGGQAPAPDVLLAVGDATVMFTDLTKTAQYFYRHGDRAGIHHIRRRLDIIVRGGQSAGGIRVKTLGDGVLMLFSTPLAAVQAALAILAGPAAGKGDEPHLRVGIARGALLTEHTDAAGFDCSGATVSEAARAVYGAAPNQLRMTASVGDHPAVRSWLAHVEKEVLTDKDGLRTLCVEAIY